MLTLWSTPIWMLVCIGALAFLSASLLFALQRSRRRGRSSHCRACDYELRGVDRLCPECGCDVSARPPRRGTRVRSPRLKALAGTCAACALAVWLFAGWQVLSGNPVSGLPMGVIIGLAERQHTDALAELDARINSGAADPQAAVIAELCARRVEAFWHDDTPHAPPETAEWVDRFNRLYSRGVLQDSDVHRFLQASFRIRPMHRSVLRRGEQFEPTFVISTAAFQNIHWPLQMGPNAPRYNGLPLLPHVHVEAVRLSNGQSFGWLNAKIRRYTPDSIGGAGGISFGPHSGSDTSQWEVDATQSNTLTVEIDTRFEIVDGSMPRAIGPASSLYSRSETFTFPIRLVPEDASLPSRFRESRQDAIAMFKSMRTMADASGRVSMSVPGGSHSGLGHTVEAYVDSNDGAVMATAVEGPLSP
ncbi:MAG: hypothetical protein AAGH64_06895, partial [Planctomycetota bacterium]